MELESGFQVYPIGVFLKVSHFTGVSFIQNGIYFVFFHPFGNELCVCRFTGRSTWFFIRIHRGFVFFLVRQTGVVFMVFGG